MPKALVIVHFQPLELYPPVMNLVKFLEKQDFSGNITVIATNNPVKSLAAFKSSTRKIKIYRFGKINLQFGLFLRVINYIWFNLFALIKLILNWPGRILYYETLSSYPVYFYKKYINRKAKIYVHYHEYTSPGEYASGMKLVRFFHKREKYLYDAATWISHTNDERLKKFVLDEGLKRDDRFKLMPNYPPLSWLATEPPEIVSPINIIYVGALSLSTMYTREFVNWVLGMNGKVRLDIYSNNVTTDALIYLQHLELRDVHLFNGVDYDALPHILKNYHIGVILYKGHIENYIHNAPNKLFEYLACGLDVWYPDIMKGCMPYMNVYSLPKVLPIDFENLDNFSLTAALGRANLSFKKSEYFCEDVYKLIYQDFVSED